MTGKYFPCCAVESCRGEPCIDTSVEPVHAFIEPSKKPLPKQPRKPLHACGVVVYAGGIKKTLVFLNLCPLFTYAYASKTPRCHLCACLDARPRPADADQRVALIRQTSRVHHRA